MHGMEKARVALADHRELRDQVFGGGGRCALYWSYISLRSVCSEASRITAMWVGPSARLRLLRELPQHGRIAIDGAGLVGRACSSAASADGRRGRCSSTH